ncbi:MAG: peptidylprolyl isomerase [Candidatus Thermoplasmatota archaeon]|nr:peptidylprolyl isomerase [Candidatus Thermoplasmatota archaeon]
MDEENPICVMDTSEGQMRLELFKKSAPETVDNFIKYAENDFYSGTIFHRIIEGFMIQGGGLTEEMSEKETPYEPIKNEAEESGHRNERGTIAMARTSDPDSATSQFFINLEDNRRLDWDEAADGHGYCVFGEVIDGMDVVDKIGAVETVKKEGRENVPVEDIKIKKVEIEDQ